METITRDAGKELLSSIQLRQIMPHASQKVLNSFLIELNRQLPLYQINTPLRVAAFVAQGTEETGELRSLSENMNYSAKRMMQVWPTRFRTLEAALPYEHNPAKLGNNVYANRMGNGGPETGDGYKYRGRGWFNTTGKVLYKQMANVTGIDFINNPDLLALPRYAIQSGCEFWKMKNLNPLADAQDLRALTKKLNGGYINMDTRLRYYKAAKAALGIQA